MFRNGHHTTETKHEAPTRHHMSDVISCELDWVPDHLVDIKIRWGYIYFYIYSRLPLCKVVPWHPCVLAGLKGNQQKNRHLGDTLEKDARNTSILGGTQINKTHQEKPPIFGGGGYPNKKDKENRRPFFWGGGPKQKRQGKPPPAFFFGGGGGS